jgi:hypothetical protein
MLQLAQHGLDRLGTLSGLAGNVVTIVEIIVTVSTLALSRPTSRGVPCSWSDGSGGSNEPHALLCRDDQGGSVAVEVKRRGEIDGVGQLCRYLQRLGMSLGTVGGVFAALAFPPQARVLAADREVACVPLDDDALRGMEPLNPTLF